MVHDYEDRFRMRGPEVVLSAELATQIGLVLHELATNAAKYGALSVPAGLVDVIWSVTRTKLRLMWREHGGPAIEHRPEFSGFGTLLIRSSASKVSQRFASDGLVCKLEFLL
jgi:two-component sensor histidine kinase